MLFAATILKLESSNPWPTIRKAVNPIGAAFLKVKLKVLTRSSTKTTVVCEFPSLVDYNMHSGSRRAIEEVPFLPAADTSTVSWPVSSSSATRRKRISSLTQGIWIHLFLIILYSGCTFLYISSLHNEGPSSKIGISPKSEEWDH